MSAGRMPTDTLLFKMLGPKGSASGTAPGKLRLILAAERIGANCPPMSSTMLSDLRIFTKARICYALTAAEVCGAIAQSHLFDYRITTKGPYSHFGVPLSSVEIKLINSDDGKLGGHAPQGEVRKHITIPVGDVLTVLYRSLFQVLQLQVVRSVWECRVSLQKTTL
jgi:hypothetical protein